jgi:3-deoxy-D-manno-octulosonic-acid transferase
MLSKLYRWATIAYIGGGFNNGVHNILEAAVYGKPVVFGPEYGKFREAVELIQYGGGISIRNHDELTNCINKFLTDQLYCEETGKKSFEYVRKNKGATEKILNYIQEKRLLTK